ncbi:MAG: acetylglutamate kinase [Ardenticatenales bacterium]|nr:acetylglutamate kinase [Ardenticatenales bacterium]
MIVIKVGGNELDNESFLRGFAQAVAALPEAPVIVHGGGRGTTMLMERFGLEARFVEGLRVTDAQTLELAVMGMVGQASMRLVQALVNAGVPALGLSGVDAGLVTAEPVTVAGGDLGAVGQPVAVASERLLALLNAGFVPCLAPISRGRDGALLNVNADAVAQAVAAALDAERLLFLTNVAAVTIDGQTVRILTPAEIDEAIQSGEISGGMIPKTRAAVAALQAGVRHALITDLAGLTAISQGHEAGTIISKEMTF